MGIVHHSNYLRICEEARVAWCLEHGFLDSSSEAVFSLTVLETRVQHIKPARYGDEVVVSLQIKTKGVRLYFQYLIHSKDSILSKAETIHCSLDTNMKVKRLEEKLVKLLEKETWTETWL